MSAAGSNDDLEPRVTALERKIDAVTREASDARLLARAADRDCSEMRDELRGHKAVLNALRETQLEHGMKLGTLDSKVGRLDSKVGTLDSKVGTLDSKVGRLDSKVGTLDSKVGTLDSKVEELESKVNDGFAKMGAGMAYITALLEGIAGSGQ